MKQISLFGMMLEPAATKTPEPAEKVHLSPLPDWTPEQRAAMDQVPWVAVANRVMDQWGGIMEVLIEMAVLDLRTRGGPNATDFARAREVGRRLSVSGDSAEGKMKGKGATWGKSAAEAEGIAPPRSGEVAKALACGAWCPGGLHFNGRHWEER